MILSFVFMFALAVYIAKKGKGPLKAQATDFMRKYHDGTVLLHADQTTVPPSSPVANTLQQHKRQVSNFMKKRVAAKQKWRCSACGGLLDESFQIDHIKEIADGGGNEEENLTALHVTCHALKTSRWNSERGHTKVIQLKTPRKARR